MEFILPCSIEDKDNFCNRAVEVGFTEFVAKKFIYTMQDSDLDVFPVMATERMSLLLYGWELCDGYVRRAGKMGAEVPDNALTVMKKLTNYSLHLWFSREWERCADKQKAALLFCLRRAAKTLQRAPQVPQLKWDFLLKFDKKPWECEYFKQFFEGKARDSAVHMHEDVEEPASDEDIYYVRKEDLLFVLLRLIKLFDGGYINGARKLAMRVIVAWNQIFKEMAEVSGIEFPEITAVKKEILLLICHVHLMTIYEIDDKRGLVIDNMMSNIHFYAKNMQKKLSEGAFNIDYADYTAAQYIALTCINLRLKSSDFIDAFAFNNYPKTFTTLFGAISQSYGSYLLGNVLMEMNNMSKRDFEDNLERYKVAISLYVNERERSEKFLQAELRKKDKQRTSHNKNITLKRMTDLESKIRKGNYTNSIEEETVTDLNETEEDHLPVDDEDSNGESKTRKIKICSDPIFENMPNKECLLTYSYDVIANRAFKGWRFAKIVLLIKIISHQLNAIETWRYHPGLTTEFMLNLEVRLARHFEDMAKIFHEHDFMEQEFWLTAFYLDPTTKYYKQLIECGTRFFRRRQLVGEARKSVVSAKFGLLSSTIDVNEILHMTNHANPNEDYDPLEDALRTLRLPKNVVKDLLTITFLPRNKSFSWAVKWAELRKRCKNLLNKPELKRRFVEMNMAEANDRLQFLHIDYDKYKHRPQINYGTIEEGYEGGLIGDLDDDEEEDDDYEDYDEYEDYSATAKKEKEETKIEELDDSYFAGTRRTRARVAAVIATAMMKDEPIKMRPKSQPKSAKESSGSSVSSSSESEKPTTSTVAPQPKRNLEQLLTDRPTFDNNTPGFKAFPDIWDFDNEDLNALDKKSFAAFEIRDLVQDFTEMKQLVAPITQEPPREPITQKSPRVSPLKRSRSSVCRTPEIPTVGSKKPKLDAVETPGNSRGALSDVSSSEETKHANIPKRLLRSMSHLNSDDEHRTNDDLNAKSLNETYEGGRESAKVPSPGPKLKKPSKKHRTSVSKIDHAKTKSKKKSVISRLKKNIKANEKQEKLKSASQSPPNKTPKSAPNTPKSAAKSSHSVQSSPKSSPKALRSSSMCLRASSITSKSAPTSPKSDPIIEQRVLVSSKGSQTTSKSAPTSPQYAVSTRKGLISPAKAELSTNKVAVSPSKDLGSPNKTTVSSNKSQDKGALSPTATPVSTSSALSPNKATKSPNNALMSPTKAPMLVSKGAESPKRAVGSPAKAPMIVSKDAESPKRSVGSPAKAPMIVSKDAESPKSAVVSPAKALTFVNKGVESPKRAVVSADTTTSSSVSATQTATPPGKTTVSPSKASGSPKSAPASPKSDLITPNEAPVALPNDTVPSVSTVPSNMDAVASDAVSPSKTRVLSSPSKAIESTRSAPASPEALPTSSKEAVTSPNSGLALAESTSLSPKHGVAKDTDPSPNKGSVTPKSEPSNPKTPPMYSKWALMRQDCLERKCFVVVTRLSKSDFIPLRQPKVMVERINLETFLKKATVTKRLEKRGTSRTSYVDIDENSSSNSGPSTRVKSKRTKRLTRDRVPALRAQQHATVYSESSLDCEEYEQPQRSKRPRGGRSSGQIKSEKTEDCDNSRDNNRRCLRTRQLKVTPRSASGLKLRISTLQSEGEGTSPNTAERSSGTRKFAPYNDIIQISSTDSMLESDPLYEEEVILP